jgi:glycosyltransferase involved in cell wall biosynthesis
MADKKSVLFVNYSLHSGGIEKSLVTVLSLFDYGTYDVDLQLFANEGMFLSRVPSQVHLLRPLFPAEYRQNIRRAFFLLLLKGHPLAAACRLLVTFAGRRGTVGERLAKMWKIESRFIRPSLKRYDAVVAFMEGQPIYYAASKVAGRRKIGFIHGDYSAMGLDRDFDLGYFQKLDALCTVSESCLQSLRNVFPEYSDRLRLIFNIISPEFIRTMAEKGRGFDDGFSGPRILSIARLSLQKGLDLAMPAIVELKKKGLSFRWYIIGIGPEEERLKAMVQDLGIGDRVRFLGEQPNPYPFLKKCDIYFQPSRFEGKAIAVDEAKVMCRPILLTDFSTAADQIDSGRNGLIVPMTPDGILEGLESLLLNEERCAAFSESLSRLSFSNEDEINKLYALICDV